MHEFGFSKLTLLLSSLMGLLAFSFDFYQIEATYQQLSGYGLVESWLTTGIQLPVIALQGHDNILVHIAGWFLFLFPIVMGLVALELLIRSLFSQFRVVHRAWLMAIYSLSAIAVGWWLSQTTGIDLYFFEMVKSGYWWSLAMVTWSFVAFWID